MLRLKELRLELGLQSQDVAQKLGISKQAYSNYEGNRREPDVETLCLLADFFGVSIDYLVGRPTIPASAAPREKAILSVMSKLDEHSQKDVISYATFLAAKRERIDIPAEKDEANFA